MFGAQLGVGNKPSTSPGAPEAGGAPDGDENKEGKELQGGASSLEGLGYANKVGAGDGVPTHVPGLRRDGQPRTVDSITADIHDDFDTAEWLMKYAAGNVNSIAGNDGRLLEHADYFKMANSELATAIQTNMTLSQITT